jgi:hypothetical protein
MGRNLFRGLAGAAGFGGVAGLGAMAAGVLTRFTVEATKAAVAAETLAAKNNKALTELQRTVTTTEGQCKIFKEQVTNPISETIGAIVAKDLREVLTMANVATGAMQRFRDTAGTAGAGGFDQGRYDELKKKRDAQGGLHDPDLTEFRNLVKAGQAIEDARYAESLKKAAVEFRLGAEEADRRMHQAGEHLRAALATPAESYRAAVEHAQQLHAAGAISAQTLTRALEKAQSDLNAATARRNDMARAMPGVGAAERHTMAGFSAAQSGKRELERLCEFQRQQLAEDRKHTALLQSIEKTNHVRPINLKASSL